MKFAPEAFLGEIAEIGMSWNVDVRTEDGVQALQDAIANREDHPHGSGVSIDFDRLDRQIEFYSTKTAPIDQKKAFYLVDGTSLYRIVPLGCPRKIVLLGSD